VREAKMVVVLQSMRTSEHAVNEETEKRHLASRENRETASTPINTTLGFEFEAKASIMTTTTGSDTSRFSL